jgi:hypothetical protein
MCVPQLALRRAAALAALVLFPCLLRAQGTFSHTTGTASYTVSKTFTATATVSAQKAGMFNAATGGTMCFENTFSAVTLNSGDTLTITWTVNY